MSGIDFLGHEKARSKAGDGVGIVELQESGYEARMLLWFLTLAAIGPLQQQGDTHALVVSDGNAMTRVNYKTGAACARARDAVRRQVAPQVPPSEPGKPPAFIPGPPRTTAFCIPL